MTTTHTLPPDLVQATRAYQDARHVASVALGDVLTLAVANGTLCSVWEPVSPKPYAPLTKGAFASEYCIGDRCFHVDSIIDIFVRNNASIDLYIQA